MKMKSSALMLRVVFFLLFTLLFTEAHARSFPGYIITLEQDTVYGNVKSYRYNRLSGALNLTGFSFEPLFLEVTFKPANGSEYQTYRPDELAGYGFQYKDDSYRFHSYVIENKSMVRHESSQERFLLLLSSGDISLYLDKIRGFDAQYANETISQKSDNSYLLDEYYIYSAAKGLSSLHSLKESAELMHLLLSYGMEEQYLLTYLKDLKINNIRSFFHNYERWKREVADRSGVS